MRLTDQTIRPLACPAGKSDQTFWDSELPGFGLRARASGAKTWIVQFDVHGRSQKISLGSPKVVAASAARAKAKELIASKQLGGNPAGAKAMARAAAAKTIGHLLPGYLAWKSPRLRPRTVSQTLRHLQRHLAPLHREPVASVTRAMVAQRLGELTASNGSGEATRARSSWSAFFRWACQEGLIESNPTTFTNAPREATARQHAVSASELGAIWRALDGDGVSADYAAIVRLLILTGARRDEIASLERCEVDLDAALISLPPGRVKNGRQHLIPLAAPAVAILKAQMARQPSDRALLFGKAAGPFGAFSQCKRLLDAKLGDAVAPFILHDLRRAISTSLHETPFSVAPHIVETILGHVGGHKAGVAGVYNGATYLEERRDALNRWAAHVMQITGSNVVRIGAAA